MGGHLKANMNCYSEIPVYVRNRNTMLNEQNDKEKRDMLILNNLRLVFYIAQKYGDDEEYISEGMIGLIKAVDTFDADRNVQFATYATKCIKNNINMYLRRQIKHEKCISANSVIYRDHDGGECTLEEVLFKECELLNNFENIEYMQQIYSLIQELPDRERKIIKMLYGFDARKHTQKEVADCLGISQSYVCRLEKDILKKLRVKLEKL